MEKSNKKYTVRGCVIAQWQQSGRPDWNIFDTMSACIEADKQLETRGLKPAVQFRKAIKHNNNKYIRTWTFGCHFPWLNPRKKE